MSTALRSAALAFASNGRRLALAAVRLSVAEARCGRGPSDLSAALVRLRVTYSKCRAAGLSPARLAVLARHGRVLARHEEMRLKSLPF